jgi:exodeoxyribonuclease VII small subunit
MGDLDLRAMNETPDFEKSLAELEALIARLERGDLPLAESLTLFEQGVALTRQCHERLTEARTRVQILLQDGARSFDPDAAAPDE